VPLCVREFTVLTPACEEVLRYGRGRAAAWRTHGLMAGDRRNPPKFGVPVRPDEVTGARKPVRQSEEMRLLEAEPLARFVRGGRSFEHVMRARFETGLAGSGDGSRFELVYGTEGSLAEVPIVISYQPKWWLQVELTIES